MNKDVQHIHKLRLYSLREQEIHIWHTQMPEALDAETYLSVLDKQERERYHAYKAPGKQIEFLFGRYFIKRVLAAYLQKEATEIHLHINVHKRPYLPQAELQFNLTHSFGGFALIVSKKLPVGIDLEYVERKISIEDGRHVFMPEELRSMKSKPKSAAKEEFLQRWTLKEAIYKAADKGPELFFNEFAVDLEKLSIHSTTPLLPELAREIQVKAVMDSYLLAYAIENPEKLALIIQHFYWA